MTQIRLEGITVRYGEIVALDSVDLLVRHEETMGVLGPSGCGKTTLLRTIAGLIKPNAGHLYFDGYDVTTHRPAQRGVGMVFQDYALYPHLDSRDNIAFPLRVRKQPNIDARVKATACRLHIDEAILRERRPTTLAGGEQQQVALGRALVANPTVLLMDEPMSNLDAHTRAYTRAQLGRLIDDFGITAVYVTHDQQEAMALADRVAVMRRGYVMQVGTPGELWQQPTNVFVAQFVGSPAMNILAGHVAEGRLWIEEATASVLLPPIQRYLADDEPVLVGIRPEHLSADPGGILPVEIIHIEPLLTQRAQLVYGKIAGQSIVAQLPASIGIRLGQTLTLAVDSQHIYLFDPRDETRV